MTSKSHGPPSLSIQAADCLLHIFSSIYTHGCKHLGPSQNHLQLEAFEIKKHYSYSPVYHF